MTIHYTCLNVPFHLRHWIKRLPVMGHYAMILVRSIYIFALDSQIVMPPLFF
jgi:hypothetical protein